MAITNGYATLTEIKAWLGITDNADDSTLENCVEAASRKIDKLAGRRFYAVSETRYYTPQDNLNLWIDDLASITSLETDDDGDGTFETLWASTDYRLMPLNAPLSSNPMPYTWIEVNRYTGNNTFIRNGVRTVKIVGSFGYSTTPDDIKLACLTFAARLFKRKDAIFGVLGAAELGTLQVLGQLKKDSEFMELISNHTRHTYPDNGGDMQMRVM